MEPQPKYREKVLIGLESAPPSFDVRSKVMGPGGANLQYITNETGAIVTIRGKGSGFIEPATGHESLEPLHICVEHSKYEVLQAGRQLAFNLIETVQQEWSNTQQQPHQQPAESQQQGPVQQHVQSISVHSQLGSTSSVQASQGQETVLPTSSSSLQLQLPLFTPPPSLAVPPPPIHLTQTQPIQVSVSNSSGGQTHQAATSSGGGQSTQDTTSQQQAIVQQTASLQAADLQHQIQIQPQQVYVSQGGGVIQPATIIPQQQIQPTSILAAHQPQIITQSYPIQYVQASNEQMVVAYPNIVRPVATDTSSAQQPQVMLVQYAPQRPLLHGRTTTQSHTIPQIVQIVNPQTGQVQHVLQHIQPQIQMQQLALATSAGQVSGGAVVGGQVLMPLQQSSQQQQILTTQQGGQPIHFATQHQGMIIASQPHQVAVSQANLQQAERGSPQVVQQQVIRPGQGVKRRYESGPSPSNQLPPNYQNIPPPQQSTIHPQAMAPQPIRKGIGSDGIQQQNIRPSQQAQQQQHIQQQLLQQQQQQQAAQQMIQHQQQIQVVQQNSIDESQQIDEKALQQQTLQTDDWRLQQQQQQQQQQPQHQGPQYIQMQAHNSPSSNNDGNKVDQPKRGRPAQSSGGGDSQNEGRPKGQMDLSKQQQQASYAYQPQPQAKQQQMQQFGGTGGPVDGYGPQGYQSQSYTPLYQQPPPASFQQQPAPTYNSWLMPQQ